MGREIFDTVRNGDMKQDGLTQQRCGQTSALIFRETRVQASLFLIANLELDFELSGNDFRCLQIPNRKYFAIFRSLLRPSQPAASRATLTLRAPQSNLPPSCFVRAPLGEHS
jgi:hypothetical protein